MRWQNPWAWLGLLSLALPVLVHLFTRRQARVEPFPSLRFLQVSRLLPTRSTRLTDIPLLLLRLAICAAAVAALAQPLWRPDASRRGSADAIARAIVVDTSTLSADTTAAAFAERVIAERLATSETQHVVRTDAPALAIDGARAWLETLTGRGEIVVMSAFAAGALDSTDLTAIPAHIGLSFTRLPAATGALSPMGAGADASLIWHGDTTADGRQRRGAIQAAVASLGASLSESRRATDTRVVHVVSPGGTIPVASKQTPVARWMGDVMLRVRRDTTLAVATASLPALADTTFAAPFVVLRRATNGAPVVAAAPLDSASELLVVSRALDIHFATASLLLAVSRAMEPGVAARAEAPTAKVSQSNTTVSDDQLQRWSRPATDVPPDTRAGVSGVSATSGNGADTGPSHGRYLWALVLLLLGVEAFVRRTPATVPRPAS